MLAISRNLLLVCYCECRLRADTGISRRRRPRCPGDTGGSRPWCSRCIALSGGNRNCRTWVRRARDPGPGPADPKRRHDERPHLRRRLAGLNGEASGDLSCRQKAAPAEAVRGSRAGTTPGGGSDVSDQVRTLPGPFRAAHLHGRDRDACPARYAHGCLPLCTKFAGLSADPDRSRHRARDLGIPVPGLAGFTPVSWAAGMLPQC